MPGQWYRGRVRHEAFYEAAVRKSGTDCLNGNESTSLLLSEVLGFRYVRGIMPSDQRIAPCR